MRTLGIMVNTFLVSVIVILFFTMVGCGANREPYITIELQNMVLRMSYSVGFSIQVICGLICGVIMYNLPSR